MTEHIADIASYQAGLTLGDLITAGFSGINVKISHELGITSVHSDAQAFVREARRAGIGVSTFHWLTGRAPGADQAAFAYSQMQQLPGGTAGIAHVVDVESTIHPPSPKHWLDYCATMVGLLGRPIATYTGDWWWLDHMAGVLPSAVSPWLWSVPRDGTLPDYPGDSATAQWRGYGGWPVLSVMQYRVSPIAGIPVSQSAIRDLGVWEAMRGMKMVINSVPASTSLLEEINWLAPNRSKLSDGTVGDLAHQQNASDHNPDETGNTGGLEDADSLNEVHARDVTAAGPWPAGWSMERIVQIILSWARAGRLPGLQNVIYNRRIWSRSWGWTEREYIGSNPHDKHAHFGFRYGSGSGSSNPENFAGPWGIKVARLAEIEEQNDMNVSEFKTALREELANGSVTRERIEQASVSYSGGPLPEGVSLGHVFSEVLENSRDIKARLAAIESRLDGLENNSPA